MPEDKKKKYTIWERITGKPTEDALKKAAKTGQKYRAPKSQSAEYLRKKIAEQMKVKTMKEPDAAKDTLSGKRK